MTLTRRAAVCSLVLCGAAALVAAARHAPPFRETADGAILQIYTLQALKGKLLVGPYSRFGWHHPGPLYFYLQAPWYWLSGLHPAGMQAGAIAINVTSVGVMAWVLAAVGTPSVPATVAAAVSFYVVRTADMIASPWNPHVIVLPMVALAIVAAGFAATGRRALLFWLIGIGSFLVQTHVAMAPIVCALTAIAAGARLSAKRQAREPGRPRSWLLPATLAAVLWLPPLIEQATRRPGNLRSLIAFFAGGRDSGVPFTQAAAGWAASLNAAFRSGFAVPVGLPFRLPESSWPLAAAAQMLGLATAIWWFHRSRRAFEIWLAAMALAASVVGFAAATRIADEIADHQLFWLSALGVLNVGIVAAVPFDAVFTRSDRANASAGPSQPGTSRRLSALAALTLFAAGVAMSAASMNRVLQHTRGVADHAVDVVADELVQKTSEAGVRRPLVRIGDPVWPVAAGALLELARVRRRFAVDDAWITMYGEAFAATGREDGVVTIEGSVVAPRVSVVPTRPR